LKVLVTRPEPGASATAERLRQMGFDPVLAPCLRIDPVEASLPATPAAILLTSGHAVDALPVRYQAVPCFCVGDATAAKLRAAGFTAVESAAGDAGDLLLLAADRRIEGLHLLAVGEGHGQALAGQLRERGIRLIRRKVYATRHMRSLPAPVKAALAAGEIGKALFYSAETLRAFIRMKPPGTEALEALALSPAIAAIAQGLPWRRIRVALAPNEADLLALLK
jgi:uroporphyrinogen-III synthase